MAIERADSILDIPAISQEVAQYIALIKQCQAALVELFNITKQYKDSNIVNLTQNTEKLTVAMNGSLETTKQVTAANEKLTKTIVAHKEKTDDEIKSQIQAREALKARTDQIKVQGDAYKQLTLDYNKAAAAAKALAAQFGVSSTQAKAATEHAAKLSAQLKSIDSSVGQHTKNVGNYGSMWEQVGLRMHGVGGSFIQLKDSLKGLGPALGVIVIGAVAVEKAFSFIKSSITEFFTADLAATKLSGILSNMGRQADLPSINRQVAELADRFKEVKRSDIQDVFAKLYTYGKLSTNQMKELLPVIIDFASKQGIDLSEATDEITKAFEGNARGLKTYGINIKEGKDLTERFGIVMSQLAPKVAGFEKLFEDTLPGALKKNKIEIEELQRDIGEDMVPIMKTWYTVLHWVIGGLHDVDVWVGNLITTVKNGGDILSAVFTNPEAVRDSAKAMDDMAKKEADLHLAAAKFKDQDVAHQATLMKFYELQLKNRQEQYDLQVKSSGKQALDARLYKGTSLEGTVKDPKAALDQLKAGILTTKYMIQQAHDIMTGNTPVMKDPLATNDKEDKLKELEDFAKGFISILDKIGEYDEKTGENALTGFQKEIKQAIDENKNFNREIEELRTADQEKLKKHFADGEIELKQYTDVSRGINEHAHADQVAAELALQNRIKEIKDKFEKERDAKAFADAQKQHDKMAKEMADKSKQDVEDELAAAQLAFQKSGKLKDQLKEIQKQKDASDHASYAQFGEFGTTPDSGRLTTELGKNAETAKSAANDAKVSAAEKVIDKIKNYSVDAEHIIGGIIEDETTKKLNALNKIEVAQQKAYEKEIAGVNLSSLSQQDKAAKLKILESDRQVQVEQNARAQKKIDEDKAKFDKAKSIVSIVESTAEAVIKALVSTPPDVPLALIVGALGAAELAIAIAQPIPHYKEGTMKGHTGGLAVVGDGGAKELILEPGKDPYYSPAVPTVMSLAKHTQVIPIDQVEEMRRGSMQVNPFGYLVGEGNTPREIVNQLKIQNSIQQKQLEALALIANKRDRPIIIKNDVSNYEKRVRI